MSDKKITQLPPLANPTIDDLMAIVNSSTTKKTTLRDLFKSFIDTELNLGFFLVPAGTVAPDGEYYYMTQTESSVAIQEGDIASVTPMGFFSDAKSKQRVEHAVNLPDLGWQKREIDTQKINDILFIDQMNGIAVSEGGKIYKTIDAGRSWTQKYTNGGSNPITSLDLDNIIIGTPPAGTRPRTLVAVGGTFFYYSTDLGDTWTPTDISNAQLKPGERYIGISGLSNPYYVIGSKGTLVLVQQSATGTYTVQYISSEAVGDFTALKVMRNPALPATAAGLVLYATANVTVAGVGVTGKVLKSTNAGTSFVEILSAAETSLIGLYFSDINNGWICGGITTGNFGMIYKTINGGTSWSVKDLSSINANSIHDIYFDGNGIGWAVGENSTIVKSSDWGSTWTKDALFLTEQGGSKNLIAVTILTGNAICIAGDTGGFGNLYYFISDTINGIVYTYTPVDTIWIKVTSGDEVKQGFVAALTVL